MRRTGEEKRPADARRNSAAARTGGTPVDGSSGTAEGAHASVVRRLAGRQLPAPLVPRHVFAVVTCAALRQESRCRPSDVQRPKAAGGRRFGNLVTGGGGKPDAEGVCYFRQARTAASSPLSAKAQTTLTARVTASAMGAASSGPGRPRTQLLTSPRTGGRPIPMRRR